MARGTILCIVLFIGFFLTGCNSQQQTQGDLKDLFGTYSATGTITSTGTSLFRRGTHVLSADGGIRFYLESRKVDLSQFANSYAVVRGEVVPNTHEKFLPVLVVESAEEIKSKGNSELQKYTIASLGISLEASKTWISTLDEGSLSFNLAEEKGSFIRIEASPEKLPEGLHVRIDGRNGIRTVDESEKIHRIYVERKDNDIILFTFSPKGERSALLRDVFYTMVQSVKFKEDSEGGEEVKGSLQPCGGSAGVLCPEGEYCEVKELDTGIGVCREVSSF